MPQKGYVMDNLEEEESTNSSRLHLLSTSNSNYPPPPHHHHHSSSIIRTTPMSAEDADYPEYGLTELIDPEDEEYEDMYLKKKKNKKGNSNGNNNKKNINRSYRESGRAEEKNRLWGADGDDEDLHGYGYGMEEGKFVNNGGIDDYSSHHGGAYFGAGGGGAGGNPYGKKSSLSGRTKCFIILAVTLIFVGAVVAVALIAYHTSLFGSSAVECKPECAMHGTCTKAASNAKKSSRSRDQTCVCDEGYVGDSCEEGFKDSKYMCDVVQTCELKYNLGLPCGPHASWDYDSAYLGESSTVMKTYAAHRVNEGLMDVSAIGSEMFSNKRKKPLCSSAPSGDGPNFKGRWILPCDFPCSEISSYTDVEMMKWCDWSSAYWKPYDCILPKLELKEEWLGECAAKRTFVFVGDSTVRAIANKITDFLGLDTTPLRHHGYFEQLKDGHGVFYNYTMMKDEPMADNKGAPGFAKLSHTLDEIMTKIPPLYLSHPREVVFLVGAITLEESHVHEMVKWMEKNGKSNFKVVFKSRGYKGSESDPHYIINHHREIMNTKKAIVDNGFYYVDAYNTTMSGWHLVEKDSSLCHFSKHITTNPQGHRIIGKGNDALTSAFLTQVCF
eukprot:Nk52_evm2s150 gene=Nk52_evmTU2s150